MQGYIWIILVVFVIAIVAYLKRAKESTEESNEAESDEKYLLGMGGLYRGQAFPIGKEIIIGRDAGKCSIIYPNNAKGISSVHCKVRIENGKAALIDLASTYGTYRDSGERLSPNVSYYLEPGDGFYIGDAENTFLVK